MKKLSADNKSHDGYRAWRTTWAIWNKASSDLAALNADWKIFADDRFGGDADKATSAANENILSAVDLVLATSAPRADLLVEKIPILEAVAFDDINDNNPTSGIRVPALMRA